MKKSKGILIVANRWPVQRVKRGGVHRWVPSSGGLVTAMSPILQKHGGCWIGWSGAAGPALRPFAHNGVRVVSVGLLASEIDSYYSGFCNATIWPLYHDAIRTPIFLNRWWKPYVEVNWRFARAAARYAEEGQSVWIHDYQLQLVPRMLRELRPDIRIGFFLHIPFPPDEIFAWLPWRREILEGLLGADVVGFQTTADARDFARAARELTSAEGTDTLLTFAERSIRVGSFPISVDTAWFERQAARPETIQKAQMIRRQVGVSRKILLSVDRLDYTKGIDNRLVAFWELLRRKRVTAADCVLIQVAVPSRESVAEYGKMRTQIERMVGRINGEFSAPGHVPVHYFRRNLSREDVVAFYMAADVMVVTPLKDGMNLVCKEYVATRLNNSGVLVLSEFAGAARELRQALLVNPRDIDGTVRVLDSALHLPPSDARMRMSILRTVVRRHNVFTWADNFLEALQE